MQFPFTKAYECTCTSDSTVQQLYVCTTDIINISDLISTWNDKLPGTYNLIQEVPISKAIHKRGLSGSTINMDWKLLADRPVVSIVFSTTDL